MSDTQLNLATLRDNAVHAIPELRQEQQLDKPAYPAEEPATEAQEFRRETLTDRFANFWTNLHAAWLRRCIASEQRLIDGMPSAVARQKAQAERDHQQHLQQIDRLAEYNVAKAKLEIQHHAAKLARMGYDA